MPYVDMQVQANYIIYIFEVLSPHGAHYRIKKWFLLLEDLSAMALTETYTFNDLM